MFIYILLLTLCFSLSARFIPVSGALSGLAEITEQSALSNAVSFAQWLVAAENIAYTFGFILSAPVILACVCTLLFSGVFGSFAGVMEITAGFPAKEGAGFWGGYKKRFMAVFILFYIFFVVIFVLTLVWIIAAVPLAVIKELESRGAIQSAAYNVSLAVTLLVAYVGLHFLRIYQTSLIAALYSGSKKPVRAAFSFSGRNFFNVAKLFLATDIIIFFMLTLYGFLNGPVLLLAINCFIFTVVLYYLFFSVFDDYAADGYGYDEIDDAGYEAIQ